MSPELAAELRLIDVCLLLARRRIHRGSRWEYDGRTYTIAPPPGMFAMKH
jgi:hypothetical protein